MKDRGKLAQKIAKLLRRAERDDGPEADTARRLAEDLMSKHGLTVELHEVSHGPEPTIGERMVLFTRTRAINGWAQFLLQEMAPMYSCLMRPEAPEGVGWLYYIVGPPAQVELCAIHFEYLHRKIQVLAEVVGQSMYNPMSPFGLSANVRDAIHWGVMDGLRHRLSEKLLSKQQAANPSTAESLHTVTVIPGQLALPAAEHVAVQGNEIVPCQPGETPFGLGFELPDDVDLEEGPRWAWKYGFDIVDALIDPEPPSIVYARCSQLDLPSEIVDALAADHVNIVAQLVRMRPSSLLQVQGIGELDVVTIIRALAAHGLLLAAEWTDGVS